MKQTVVSVMRPWFGLALALAFVGISASAQGTTESAASSAGAQAPAAGASNLSVSFKLDPRMSGPTYGGERWVSPPTFMGAAAQDTVQARVEATDARGRPVKVTPSWTSADPEMVVVSPDHGNAVSIVVKKPGTTKLALAAPGVTKELTVKAELKGKALLVEISQ